jgi:tRNA A37 threonylcarbamoyladenosine synthetase subunit TsaC/SUA5/YrdC
MAAPLSALIGVRTEQRFLVIYIEANIDTEESTLTQHPALDESVRGRPDIEADKRRLIDVVTNGGIAIIPSNLGYAFVAGTAEATRRIIEVKQRGPHKRQGMVMSLATEREVHDVSQRKRDIIDCITIDYNLPLGVIAQYRPDHPLIKKLDPYLLKVGTARGSIGTAVNDGAPFNVALEEYSREHWAPFFGSSANLTGRGCKHRVEDIEPEVIAAADLVLDYGLCRYHAYRNTSTQINFDTMEVMRVGACYELIADILKRRFNWELPLDLSGKISEHGHFNEFALASAEE